MTEVELQELEALGWRFAHRMEPTIPPLFHYEIGDQLFCGMAKCTWPDHDSKHGYCRRCNLQYEEANKRLAERLSLIFDDLSVEDMFNINEALDGQPGLVGKELLRAAGIYTVRYLDHSAIQATSEHCFAG